MSPKICFKNMYIFIFVFWYSTEIFFNTTMDIFLGIPVSKINSVINLLVFALLMIQILLFQTYKKRELIIILLITVPAIIATIKNGNKSILALWMFVVASKNINLDQIIKIAYRILVVMIPTVILLCLLGFIDNKILMRGNIVRFSLGFSHPNQLGLRIFQLVVCYCYIHRNTFNGLKYFTIILAIIFIIIIPNSQTAYISLIVFLLLLIVYKFVKETLLVDIYMSCLIIGTCLFNLLSIILSYIDVNKYYVLSQIDQWLSIRFSLCHRVWMIYGATLFGQRVYITEEERKVVGITKFLLLDNSYASLILRYGIIIYLIFSIFYVYVMKRMIEKKQYYLVIIFFTFSLYGIMENGLYLIAHNIFLLAFSSLLYNNSPCLFNSYMNSKNEE